MQKLIIFGTQDIAKLAHFYFEQDSPYQVVAFTVDAAYRDRETFQGLPVVDFEEVEKSYPPEAYAMFIAVSYVKMNQLRAQKYQEAKAKGYALPSYVSSRCTYLSQHSPGDNCFILEDNIIQPFVKIGNNVTIWSGGHIGHDSLIKDHCYITSHVVVSGRVTIEPYCFLGVNATLRNGITLGESSLIGAGASLMQDSEPHSVYVPPRAIKLDKSSEEVRL